MLVNPDPIKDAKFMAKVGCALMVAAPVVLWLFVVVLHFFWRHS